MTCQKCGAEYDGGVCPSCGMMEPGKMLCKSCGAVLNIGTVVCPKCGGKDPEHFCEKDGTRVPISAYGAWSILSGLLSLVFSIWMFSTASIVLHMGDSNFVFGVLGVIASIVMLVGGVVSVIQCQRKKQTASLLLVVYFIGSLLCLVLMFIGPYIETSLFAWWCLICAVVALVTVLRT